MFIIYFGNRHLQGMKSGESPSSSRREPTVMQPIPFEGEVFGLEEDNELEEPKVQRDDLQNPFWIDDKEVLNGPKGHLKTKEIQFWNGTCQYL